ncbi:MAG TPA: hypothetical protein VK604_07160 [Bryobacteraceae bacterium]|nr:hypothetical protein [Bryobacteraceae bacterium]
MNIPCRNKPRGNPLKSREQGSALIEFTLCCGFFLLPLLLGVLLVGQNLLRAMEVTQVCRDAAHMFASGADLSQTSYKNLVVNLAPALGMSTTSASSHGVVILSEIARIDDTCAGTVIPMKPKCGNAGYYVVVRRIVIGNSGMQASVLGTPSSALIEPATGNVTQNGYLSDSSTQASTSGVSFAPPIDLPTTQHAYVAEMYVTSPTATGWSTAGPPSVSAKFIF